MPFTEGERLLLLECLDAIDAILVQPTTTRMKLELASAVLLYACRSARMSVITEGHSEEVDWRFEALEELARQRARELRSLRGR